MLDTSCGEEFEQDVRSFAEEQPGVERIDLLHTRQFGSKVYIELEIAVRGDMPLVDAHAIAENVHRGLERRYPNVKHVMVHVNPDTEK